MLSWPFEAFISLPLFAAGLVAALHCIDSLRSIRPHLAANGPSLKRKRERVREKERVRKESLDHRPHGPHAAGLMMA